MDSVRERKRKRTLEMMILKSEEVPETQGNQRSRSKQTPTYGKVLESKSAPFQFKPNCSLFYINRRKRCVI